MLPATSAALVGAGVLSVLVYPLIAVTLHRPAPLTPADVELAAPAAAVGQPPDRPVRPEPDSPGPAGPDPTVEP